LVDENYPAPALLLGGRGQAPPLRFFVFIRPAMSVALGIYRVVVVTTKPVSKFPGTLKHKTPGPFGAGVLLRIFLLLKIPNASPRSD
jgi:hypothetical protein